MGRRAPTHIKETQALQAASRKETGSLAEERSQVSVFKIKRLRRTVEVLAFEVEQHSRGPCHRDAGRGRGEGEGLSSFKGFFPFFLKKKEKGKRNPFERQSPGLLPSILGDDAGVIGFQPAWR